MSRIFIRTAIVFLLVAILGQMVWSFRLPAAPEMPASLRTPPEAPLISIAEVNAIEVARVFGRAPACADVSPAFIMQVAIEARGSGMNPRVLAALIAVESGCNQWAVSRSGAIGYTQVMPRIWKDRYDVGGRYNLLNGPDNLHVGASIAEDQIRQHGLENGLQRYNGLGVGCDTCDGGYAQHVLSLAGKL